MRTFRRYYVPDAIVFIVAVTRDRQPFLQYEGDVRVFFDTLEAVRVLHPFRLLAYAVLPDHFHWLLRVENAEGNFSKVLHSVKRNFTWNYKRTHGIDGSLSAWQDRFWDHIIRSPRDLHRHFDYIHWNPVKHGYVARPEDWPHSTYRHWRDLGYYDVNWRNVDVDALVEAGFE